MFKQRGNGIFTLQFYEGKWCLLTEEEDIVFTWVEGTIWADVNEDPTQIFIEVIPTGQEARLNTSEVANSSHNTAWKKDASKTAVDQSATGLPTASSDEEMKLRS